MRIGSVPCAQSSPKRAELHLLGIDSDAAYLRYISHSGNGIGGKRCQRWGRLDSFWGARALEFVDAVERARSPADVMKLFNQSIAEAGFNAYVMVGLPDNVTTFPKRLMANGWPDEWADLYIKENLCEVDPVALHCMRTVDPFDWNTAPLDPARERKALSVMQRASDFRMKHGFCVPIHYGDGSGGAAVSIAGEQPDLARGVRSAMLLMSLYAHHRVRGLLTPPRPEKAAAHRAGA